MKRIPSNRLPAYVEPKTTLRDVLILGLFVTGLGWVCWTRPWLLLIPFVVTAAAILISWFDGFRQRRIAVERAGESLCTFARSFEFRSVDTWIIRAVYEQLKPYVVFPMRKTDNFARDLYIDREELDDIAEEVAQRTGRSLTNVEQNPLFGKVETIADLVAFFTCQPASGPYL
jgi:hypothetical protein